jgi:hypothetical protein
MPIWKSVNLEDEESPEEEQDCCDSSCDDYESRDDEESDDEEENGEYTIEELAEQWDCSPDEVVEAFARE